MKCILASILIANDIQKEKMKRKRKIDKKKKINIINQLYKFRNTQLLPSYSPIFFSKTLQHFLHNQNSICFNLLLIFLFFLIIIIIIMSSNK